MTQNAGLNPFQPTGLVGEVHILAILAALELEFRGGERSKGAGQGEKRLHSGQVQAIFKLSGTPFGEYLVDHWFCPRERDRYPVYRRAESLDQLAPSRHQCPSTHLRLSQQ